MEHQTNWLVHHGIQGQKWGIRRYQNKDGTLTEAGKKKYNRINKKINYEIARAEYGLSADGNSILNRTERDPNAPDSTSQWQARKRVNHLLQKLNKKGLLDKELSYFDVQRVYHKKIINEWMKKNGNQRATSKNFEKIIMDASRKILDNYNNERSQIIVDPRSTNRVKTFKYRIRN